MKVLRLPEPRKPALARAWRKQARQELARARRCFIEGLGLMLEVISEAQAEVVTTTPQP